MKEIFSAGWRFITDQCPGGKQATAASIKVCAGVLFLGIGSAIYLGPTVVREVREFITTVNGIKDSVTKLSHAMELDGVRVTARDQAQDIRLGIHETRIARLRTDLDEAERDINDVGKEIVGLKTEVRILNQTTVKVGR